MDLAGACTLRAHVDTAGYRADGVVKVAVLRVLRRKETMRMASCMFPALRFWEGPSRSV